ncbi:MAG: DUF2723 domain-containing protein [Myxococcales bacterium]|nr:DUF2723 domain-containing protein [Myxococcales bacterium]
MAEFGKIAAHEDPHAGIATLGAFVTSFCLYAITSSPTIGWLDSPEFVAQAATLGVSHSPGHPLPALLGRLAGLVPIGDLAWRVNLVSALCAAGAVALLFASLRRIVSSTAPRIGRSSARVIAMSLALAAGASWALWSNAVRAEVYALQCLLSVGAIYALLRFESSSHSRWILAASFLLALGLANHHLLALTILLPAILVILIRPSRPAPITYARAAGIGMLGLCALLYLPVRSLAHPLVNFGAPHTLERFFWTLRGAAFRRSATQEHASTPLVDAIQIVMALSEALSAPLLLFALYGAWTGRHCMATRRPVHLLLGIVLLCMGARVLLGFDPETPDHHAYLLPAILALYLLAAIGIARLVSHALEAKHPLPKAPALAAVALALLVPIQVASKWSVSSQRTAWASDDMAHWEVETLPPRSLVLLAYFQTTFRTWAVNSVEGLRPDVAYLDRSFLSYPGMRQEALHRYPKLSDLIDTPLRAGSASPVAMLRNIDVRRPVRIQLHPNVDPPLAQALLPAGPWASFSGDEEADENMRAQLARALGASPPSESSEARGALLWHDATRLDQLCIVGKREWAKRVLEDALLLAPDDSMLSEMAGRCGLGY